MELWSHQKDAVKQAILHDSFAFFMEVGTGKTATTIATINEIFAKKGLVDTLIFCPPIVVENWARELRQWLPDLPKSSFVPLTDSQVKRVKTLTSHKEKKIFITNYEALLMQDLFTEFLKRKFSILIFDESQKLKDLTTKRGKRAVALADTVPNKYILSGTPVLNTAMDVYGQFRVLDGGETFGKNFFGFRAQFFYDANGNMPPNVHFPKWIAKPGALEEINKRILEKGVVVKKKDCLKLPPLVKKKVFVPLSEEQKKHYNEMKKELISFYKDPVTNKQAVALANIALTKGLRLLQIVTGFIQLEDEQGTSFAKRFGENPRAEALKELLTELTPDHKVIVWAVFKENYEAIRKVCEEIEVGYTEIHGEISANQKQKNVDLFNGTRDVRVIFGNPIAGGIGINLIPASYSIYYSRNFSLESDLQSEARNYRGGSEVHEKITRIDLVTPATIDESVLDALSAKIKISDEILKNFLEI